MLHSACQSSPATADQPCRCRSQAGSDLGPACCFCSEHALRMQPLMSVPEGSRTTLMLSHQTSRRC